MAAPTIVGSVTSFVQNGVNAQNSWNVTLAQATTAGSELVLFSNVFATSNAYYDINGSSGNPTTNNSDTSTAENFGGNPFVAANNVTTYAVLECYRFASVTAGSTSVTVNYKNANSVGTSGLFLEIVIFELAGMGFTPLDQTNLSQLASTQSIGVVNTKGTGDFIVGQFTSGAGSQSGGGWTNVASTLMYYQSTGSNSTVTFTTTSGTDPYCSMIISYGGTNVAAIPPLILGQRLNIQSQPFDRTLLTRL